MIFNPFKTFFDNKNRYDIDAFPDMVVVINSSGFVVNTNSKVEELLHQNELSIKNISDIIEGGMSVVNQALKEEYHVVTKSAINDVFPEFVSISAKAVSQKEEILVVIRDVSHEYKKMTVLSKENGTLNNLNETRSRFWLNYIGQIKQSIQNIVGFSQALIDKLGGELSDKQEKYLNIIKKNASELLTANEKLCKLVEIESGQIDVDNKNFDILIMVSELVKKVSANFNLENKEIQINSENLLRRNICNDKLMMTTIFENILENALLHSECTRINVEISHPSNELIYSRALANFEDERSYIQISVKDNGKGIKEEILKNIFEVYSLNSKTGVGISVSKLLSKKLKGDLWIESNTLSGTVVNVLIPVEREKR